ncbi:MAG: hypothetical protein NTW78_04055 [Campylobacterales bacterium]|nr:hypothetical protein [Campylobacterales bacterium]
MQKNIRKLEKQAAEKEYSNKQKLEQYIQEGLAVAKAHDKISMDFKEKAKDMFLDEILSGKGAIDNHFLLLKTAAQKIKLNGGGTYLQTT